MVKEKQIVQKGTQVYTPDGLYAFTAPSDLYMEWNPTFDLMRVCFDTQAKRDGMYLYYYPVRKCQFTKEEWEHFYQSKEEATFCTKTALLCKHCKKMIETPNFVLCRDLSKNSEQNIALSYSFFMPQFQSAMLLVHPKLGQERLVKDFILSATMVQNKTPEQLNTYIDEVFTNEQKEEARQEKAALEELKEERVQVEEKTQLQLYYHDMNLQLTKDFQYYEDISAQQILLFTKEDLQISLQALTFFPALAVGKEVEEVGAFLIECLEQKFALDPKEKANWQKVVPGLHYTALWSVDHKMCYYILMSPVASYYFTVEATQKAWAEHFCQQAFQLAYKDETLEEVGQHYCIQASYDYEQNQLCYYTNTNLKERPYLCRALAQYLLKVLQHCVQLPLGQSYEDVLTAVLNFNDQLAFMQRLMSDASFAQNRMHFIQTNVQQRLKSEKYISLDLQEIQLKLTVGLEIQLAKKASEPSILMDVLAPLYEMLCLGEVECIQRR